MPDPKSSDAADGGSGSQRGRRFKLPAWLDHFNARDLKVLFRCWAAAWVASLLIFIGPALHEIGIATFFGALLLYIAPPAGILFVYLLAALSLLFGMCLAWAWGLLTMKAALAARPDAQTKAMVQALQQQAVAIGNQTGTNPTVEAQILVYNGFMLDARVTVIFYVMICAFVYFMSRVRVANPKFALAQIFGIIIADLFLLFGPSLPSFKAFLPEVLIKPGAIGIGLGVACSLVFFPQSTSFVALTQMEQLVRLGGIPLKCTQQKFAGESLDLQQLTATKAKTIGAIKAMQPSLAFLPLDFSRGRWSPDDIKTLQEPLRQAILATMSLMDYHINLLRADRKLQEIKALSPQASDKSDVQEKRAHDVGQYQLQESADVLQGLDSPEHGASRHRTLEALRKSTTELLELCSETSELIAQSLHAANSGRWFRRAAALNHLNELTTRADRVLQTLQSTRASCATQTTEALLDSHADLFDENGQLKSAEHLGPHALRGMVLGMVMEERILGAAETLERLLAQVHRLMQARAEDRIWIPSGLRYAFSWLVNPHQKAPTEDLTAAPATDPDDAEEQAKEAYRRLKISRGSGRPIRRGLVVRALTGFYHWFTNPGGMYALRMVVVTIAVAIPASIPHSTGFYYREKGIWALITAQTTLLVYMGDFTVSLVGRTIGTVVGGVMGMVAWYIGAGNGPGNAYGLAAITAVMTAILMWWRLFLPPILTMAAMMGGATFVLVIGFSYDDTHISQYGLPGHGYEAFWKRLVTVLLGFVAAFIVQIFPRPPSATRHICKTLSNTIGTLSDHYALLLSHWGRPETNSPIGAVAEKIALEIGETLLSIQGSIGLLKFEMTLGPFHQAALANMHVLCQDMNQALGRLLVLSTSLPQQFQERFAQNVGLLNDHHIGDIMAVLSVIEQALKSGLPLPERLPTPLMKRCFEQWNAQRRASDFNTTLVRDENYRRYCVAVSSYLKFLSTVDDMVLVLKGTLGESHLIERCPTEVPV
ncbi:hypothetical protein BDV32DRAFT_116799 [Aspergillus pseudonomiae]|uniref:Uncharacterized protein n=1 Tax=Aspergillus pseudonomiae TaxID=1506151 RepID=A0A5N6IGB9_9EURO|nr:uncharacterized protein BDV37DRAFT_18974 [Aspergillus pseudonomiae]KAB8264869.1 hypothetical protein BDV32DRAFT_116799 [Aspergillus pseudonomiae]KAE8407475.1 hypothetical protein BDV37DRAFT_18974 [Aspergillus pseudonomiae]